VQTLKGPPESGSGAGIASRLEFERPRKAGARPPPLDAAQWDETPWKRRLVDAQTHGLVAQFATDFERTTVPIALATGTRASLCIDVGEVRDGRGRAMPISEMEVELDDGPVAGLYGFVEGLLAGVPLSIETRSKAERGYALRHAVRTAPATAEHPEIDPRDSAAAALSTLLRACAAQIGDNADGALTHDDPEWIHQLRIGTRRLRSCLALMRGTVPEERRVPVADDAQWLARALGPARDLDVLVDQTLPALRERATPASDRALASFARRARLARHEARAAARAAVSSPRFTRLLMSAGALAATPRLGAPAGSQAARVLARATRRFAAPWLARRHRKLLRLAHDLAHAGPEERHAVRLAAKRLRYATEFFADAFADGHTRAYRKALARLQDELGAEVDAQVAVRLAYVIEGGTSPAARVLQTRIDADATDARRRLRKRWRAFRACRRFFDD
jgi:inorganic triphosphatase YgiF